jgi:hypothetical protein
VVVSNYLGSVTSLVATLQVIEFGSGLMAKWTFDDGTANDVIGSMNGTLQGGAQIQDGRVILNGTDAYVITAPLPADVSEKTLVAWVALDTLDQGGGGVITLMTGDGDTFDSIVYGERTPRQWMSGSDFWNRSAVDNGGSQETAGPHVLVHLAIVYKADNSIALYRNGQPYGQPYAQGSLISYSANNGVVVLGMRHQLAPGGNRMLTGEIDEASLYNRALTAAEIQYLYAAKELRFVAEPQSTAGSVDDVVDLAGVALASTPITYQWLKDGSAVVGATATNLALTLKLSDAGSYQLVASSAGVSVTSHVASVVVRDPVNGTLLHRWSFNDGTANDSAGVANGTLYGTATIVDGRLQLSGSSGANRMEATLGEALGVNKTLMAWFTLSSLDSTSGGPLAVEDATAAFFDAITYGERIAGQWMNGSDFWRRTPPDNGGALETSVEPEEIMLAITFDATAANKITLYRNGVLYGEHNQGTLQDYLANGKALIGPRVAQAGYLNGSVNEARVYGSALTASEIAMFYQLGPDQPAAAKLNYSLSGTSLTLSWSSSLAGFILESTDNLRTAAWTPVPGVVNNSVTVSTTAATPTFYRLRHP